MVGLLVSLLLVAPHPGDTWQKLDEAYHRIGRGEERGWTMARSLQDEPGEVGQIATFLLFKQAREKGDRLLAFHYGTKLLSAKIPPMMADDVLGFMLDGLKEVGKWKEALSLYDNHRLLTSPRFQSRFKVRRAFYHYLTGDKRYRKEFRWIIRLGARGGKVDLYLLMKGRVKAFSTMDLLSILKGAVSLQRWDVAERVLNDLKKRRLTRAQRLAIRFLKGRRLFRQGDYAGALRIYAALGRAAKGSLRNEALYQAGRCALFLRKPEEAKTYFKRVQGKLARVAHFTLGRMALFNHDKKGYLKQMKLLKGSLKRKLTLLVAVEEIRTGHLTQAVKRLNALPATPEVRYWRWKAQPIASRPPPLGVSFFTALSTVHLDAKENSYPVCPPTTFSSPHTVLEYLYAKGDYPLLMPYVDLLFTGKETTSRCRRAHLYIEGGRPDRAISTLWREWKVYSRMEPGAWPDDLLSLLYPRPWPHEIAAASARYHVPAPLLYSFVRQESRFYPNVRSAAGAVGLMQMLPVTASSVDPGALDLSSPAVNLDVGAHTLARLYAKFGRWDYVAAAYNAGEDAVELWKDQLGPSGSDYFWTFIPYRETKRYVDLVFSGWMLYRRESESGFASSTPGSRIRSGR